jgi:hypothetical protein
LTVRLFFWANGLETNSRWRRFEASLQNAIERKILNQKRHQARLRKLKCKNFPILKINNLSKTQNLQNSLKILVFIPETYVQIKSCYKLHKESPKKFGLNGSNQKRANDCVRRQSIAKDSKDTFR